MLEKFQQSVRATQLELIKDQRKMHKLEQAIEDKDEGTTNAIKELEGVKQDLQMNAESKV